MTKRDDKEQKDREAVAEYERRAKEIALGSGLIIRTRWRERLAAEIAKKHGRTTRTIRRLLTRHR